MASPSSVSPRPLLQRPARTGERVSLVLRRRGSLGPSLAGRAASARAQGSKPGHAHVRVGGDPRRPVGRRCGRDLHGGSIWLSKGGQGVGLTGGGKGAGLDGRCRVGRPDFVPASREGATAGSSAAARNAHSPDLDDPLAQLASSTSTASSASPDRSASPPGRDPGARTRRLRRRWPEISLGAPAHPARPLPSVRARVVVTRAPLVRSRRLLRPLAAGLDRNLADRTLVASLCPQPLHLDARSPAHISPACRPCSTPRRSGA